MPLIWDFERTQAKKVVVFTRKNRYGIECREAFKNMNEEKTAAQFIQNKHGWSYHEAKRFLEIGSKLKNRKKTHCRFSTRDDKSFDYGGFPPPK